MYLLLFNIIIIIIIKICACVAWKAGTVMVIACSPLVRFDDWQEN